MFDVYSLWGMGLFLTEFDRFKNILSNILTVQSVLVLLIYLYSLYEIFPGILFWIKQGKKWCQQEHIDTILLSSWKGYCQKMLSYWRIS